MIKQLAIGTLILVTVAIAGIAIYILAYPVEQPQAQPVKNPVAENVSSVNISSKLVNLTSTPANSTNSETHNGTYINSESGVSRINLLNSNMSYVVSDRDFYYAYKPDGIYVKTGESYVLIKGTIRNDYDQDYFVYLTAHVSNATCEYAGRVDDRHEYAAFPGDVVVYVRSKYSAPFELRIKYDKNDLTGYSLWLPTHPSEKIQI